jgi:hypothetical protein
MEIQTKKRNLMAFQYAKRNKRLKELGYKSYQEFLNSYEWKVAKVEIKNRIWKDHKKGKISRWERCGICGDTHNIQIHHNKYRKVSPIHFSDLIALCGQCHLAVHTLQQQKTELSIKSCTKRLKKFYTKNGFLPL